MSLLPSSLSPSLYLILSNVYYSKGGGGGGGGGDMGAGGDGQGDSDTTGTGLAGGGVGDSGSGLDTTVVFWATGGKDAADTTCRTEHVY